MSNPGATRLESRADPVRECDWCGRPVRRETGFERIHRGDRGDEVVVLCAQCELGTD